MANTSSSRFKVLRCLMICLGFAASSPMSAIAQIATLDVGETSETPENLTPAYPTEAGALENFTRPQTLTFDYVTVEASEEVDDGQVAQNNKKAKTAKKAKKAKQGKKAKTAKASKHSCEVFFQSTATSGSQFTVVSETRSETLIQIFESETSFMSGEAAIQVIEYDPEVSGATETGANLGSLVVTNAQSNQLTFEYRHEQITTTSEYAVVTGTVDDDSEAYIVVSQNKGGKCRLGKKAKNAKKCKQGEVVHSTTTSNGELVTTDCETLVHIFDDEVATTFTDVSTTHWASTYIYRLVSIDVVQGFPDGNFQPDNTLTLSHFAAMISRAFNIEPVRQTVEITSIDSSYWAYSDLQKAHSMGFISNVNNLDPDFNLTKLDVLVSLAQGLNYTEVTDTSAIAQILNLFSDASTIPSQYRPLIAALAQNGMLVNYPEASTLNLTEEITRAETSTLIYQGLSSLGQVEPVTSPFLID